LKPLNLSRCKINSLPIQALFELLPQIQTSTWRKAATPALMAKCSSRSLGFGFGSGSLMQLTTLLAGVGLLLFFDPLQPQVALTSGNRDPGRRSGTRDGLRLFEGNYVHALVCVARSGVEIGILLGRVRKSV
jgi:hypothetical protein